MPKVTYAEAKLHPSYETVTQVRDAEHLLNAASDNDDLPNVVRDELNDIRRLVQNFLNTRMIPYWRNASGFNPDTRG